MDIKQIQNDVLNHFSKQGLNNSLSISNATGMSQATVWRNLYEARNKVTKGLSELCKYSDIDLNSYSEVKPAENEVLMKTLTQVWNGTEAHAKKLSKLILAAHSVNMV